nr:cytochrome P450 [Agasicles hygrophila]
MLITSSWTIDLLLLLISTAFLLYKYLTRNFDHWKKQNVYYVKPVLFFGNFLKTFTFKKSFMEVLSELYDSTKAPYFGIFVFDSPGLVIRSPEIVKTILLKDFTYFRERSFASPDHNGLFSNFLLFSRYGKWKERRPKIRPIFSVNALKIIYPLVHDVNQKMKSFIDTKKGTSLNVRDLGERFAAEIVGKCFFGINAKCFENEYSEFQELTKKVITPSSWTSLAQAMYQFKPEWVDTFKLDFLNKNVQNHLVKVFNDCLNSRTGSIDKPKDYIDIILKDFKDPNSTRDEDVKSALANAVESVLAGNETLSSLLSFTLYHMTLNPEIENKAREEVQLVTEKYNGDINYDSVQEMTYIDMCLNETMRLYSSLQFLDRKTVDDYAVAGTELVIKKGTPVYIPYHSIHMDKEFFDEPEKYIPERFLDKNKFKGNGLIFMPFGAGPRMCVAAKFSKMTGTAAIADILKNFRLEKSEDTPTSLTYNPRSFTMQPNEKLKIRIVRLT